MINESEYKIHRLKEVIPPQFNRLENFLHTGHLDAYPLWMMRQAGRYLPEYHQVKSKVSNFMHACKTPKIASEITLQPLRRFELDAAIIFADILLILESFGYKVHFDGTGPKITHSQSLEDVIKSYTSNIDSDLDYVGQALEMTASRLHKNQTMIGFCGAPWTVALYAIDGQHSSLWAKGLTYIYKNEDVFKEFLELLTHASIEYLSLQVDSGAQMVMVFDSWIAYAPERFINEMAFKSANNLISAFKKRHPHIPVIYYPKGCSTSLLPYCHTTNLDVMALDHGDNIQLLQDQSSITFQGNIDHRILLTDPDCIEREVQRFKEQVARPAIINLSHGIIKETPVENVKAFVNAVRRNFK